jgi:N utilization substance protein B
MTTRRDLREWAVQLLFQIDLNRPDDREVAFAGFWADKKVSQESTRFTEELVTGVIDHQEEIDRKLSDIAQHWDIGRMGVLDRNVIRLAIYEMCYRKDIPPVVSINEAVDIAKYFSSTESGRFVNGILDRIHRDLERPSRKAAP